MTSQDTMYPIYSVKIRFEQDGEHDDRYPKWHEGLPEGRIWNSVGFHEMYREDPGGDAVFQFVNQEWWPKWAEKAADKNPGEPEIEIKGPRLETWVCEWFSHKTFDEGQSDEEALASFERYVRRYEHMQHWPSKDIIESEDYLSLMGAEDRWRWYGGASVNEKTDPPCRCEFCKEQGVIRINH